MSVLHDPTNTAVAMEKISTFSNHSDSRHLSLSSDDGEGDFLGFAPVQSHNNNNNAVEKTLWQCTMPNDDDDDAPPQDLFFYDNFEDVKLDGIHDVVDGLNEMSYNLNKEHQTLELTGNFSTNENSMFFDVNSFNAVFVGNVLNPSVSNQTLSSINSTYPELTAFKNIVVAEDIWEDKNNNNEDIFSCLKDVNYEHYNDYSVYEDLTEIEEMLNSISNENQSIQMETNLETKQNYRTKKLSNEVFQVTIAGKVFLLKNAKVVLPKLPILAYYCKKSKIEKSKYATKKELASKLFNRFCQTCDDIQETQSIRNDAKCPFCRTKLTYDCRKCHAKCETYGCMMYHIRTRLCEFGTDEKRCIKCRKIFSSIQSLKRHFSYCKKESNFRCDQCTYKTKTRRDLEKHELHKHKLLRLTRI